MIYEFSLEIYRGEDEKPLLVCVERSKDGSYTWFTIYNEAVTAAETRQILETVDAIADLNNEE